MWCAARWRASASGRPTWRQVAPCNCPRVYIYERAAAGLGFSARLFELHATLLAAAHDLIAGCPCPQGCPACVGPILENEAAQLDTKRLALALLTELTGHQTEARPYLNGDVVF